MLIVSAPTACGHARGEGRLPRRRLPLAGRHDVAHDHFGQQGRINPGALDGRLDRDRAQLRRRDAAQRTLEFPDGRTGGAEDDDIAAASTLSWWDIGGLLVT